MSETDLVQGLALALAVKIETHYAEDDMFVCVEEGMLLQEASESLADMGIEVPEVILNVISKITNPRREGNSHALRTH